MTYTTEQMLSAIRDEARYIAGLTKDSNLHDLIVIAHDLFVIAGIARIIEGAKIPFREVKNEEIETAIQQACYRANQDQDLNRVGIWNEIKNTVFTRRNIKV